MCQGAGPGRPLSKKAGGASGWASLLGAKVGVGVGEFIVCPNEGDEWLGETIVLEKFGQCLGVTSACMNGDGQGEWMRR